MAALGVVSDVGRQTSDGRFEIRGATGWPEGAGSSLCTGESAKGEGCMFLKRKPAPPIDWMIVGLGNPGRQYEGTRHNAGFAAMEALAEKLSVRVQKVKFHSFYGEAKIGDTRVLLLMPQTYMNNSGEAVREAMRFYKLPPERVLVMFDDISLSPGTVRVRRSGSAGGQKGMDSIISLCGSDRFPRIRLGIGAKPHPDYDLAAWVLSKFTKEEAGPVTEACRHAAEAACMIVAGDIEGAMSKYSR